MRRREEPVQVRCLLSSCWLSWADRDRDPGLRTSLDVAQAGRTAVRLRDRGDDGETEARPCGGSITHEPFHPVLQQVRSQPLPLILDDELHPIPERSRVEPNHRTSVLQCVGDEVGQRRGGRAAVAPHATPPPPSPRSISRLPPVSETAARKRLRTSAKTASTETSSG